MTILTILTILTTELSIIVPVGRGDLAWKKLLQDLPQLPPNWELIFVLADKISEADIPNCLINTRYDRKRLHLIQAERPGRARQLNQGGELALGHWLWFLHADSEIDHRHVRILETVTKKSEHALYYFDLSFTGADRSMMAINQFAANLRSRFLGMPFGDQGFLMQQKLWRKLGRYETDLPYGEDHKFVWTCHQKGVSLKRLPLSIRTSPRKYEAGGWFYTTKKHFILTWKQALPEIWKLAKLRMGMKS